MKKVLLIIAAFVVFSGCKENKTKQNSTQNAPTKSIDSAATPNANQITVTENTVLVPDFKAVINLDQKVFDILKNNKESVIADYYFYGAMPDDSKLADEVEKNMDLYGLKLQSGKLEIADIQEPKIIFNFKNISIPKKLYDALPDKNISLNINFYSGRKAFENNILDVDSFDSTFNDILKNNNTLTYSCKLLDPVDFQGKHITKFYE